MPAKLAECTLKGVKGYKSDIGGTCFTGPGAREKAVAQLEAINISKARKEGKAWATKLPLPKK